MIGPNTTCDDFLGGDIKLVQPKFGFRAGTDSVLLAAAVQAQPGQHVLELGCGAGAALLCLGKRVSGLNLTGVEIQPDYADIAAKNAQINGIPLEVVAGDVADLGPQITAHQFDHVMMNPPYYRDSEGTKPGSLGKSLAHHGDAGQLNIWIAAAVRRVKQKGAVVVILPASRLVECVTCLSLAQACNITVQPIAARQGRAASRVIVTARRGAAVTLLHAAAVMHDGLKHETDGNDQSQFARAVLRDGASIEVAAREFANKQL